MRQVGFGEEVIVIYIWIRTQDKLSYDADDLVSSLKQNRTKQINFSREMGAGHGAATHGDERNQAESDDRRQRERDSQLLQWEDRRIHLKI